jgi:bacterioferritin-associated ferredoxin
MPPRDHFRPPVWNQASWEGFHGGWPMMMVLNLAPKLPKGLKAEPRVHLGTYFEVDVCTFDKDGNRDWHSDPHPVTNGGATTATSAPPAPTLTVDVDFPDQYVYEVLIFDQTRDRRVSRFQEDARTNPLDNCAWATLLSIEIKSQCQGWHQDVRFLMISSTADAVSSDRIICRCLRVTESGLVEALSTEEICDLKDVRRCTGAGSGCMACHRTIKEYLERRLYLCSSSSVPPSCSER